MSIEPVSPPSTRGLDPLPPFRPLSSTVSYDKHVTPNERVTDFRTFVSGVKANHLKGGLRLRQCQEEVAAILKDRVLVGHALQNDLKVYTEHIFYEVIDISATRAQSMGLLWHHHGCGSVSLGRF